MYIPPIEDPKQITVDPTLKAIRPWWILSIGTFILYLIPEQFHARWAGLTLVVDLLASFIPSIGRWVELSLQPGNTRLFGVFVWLMIPVQCYWLISSRSFDGYMTRGKRLGTFQYSVWKRVSALLLFTLLVIVFILLPYNYALVDSAPCRFCVNTNRFAQLAIGSLFSLTASGLIAYLHALLRLFIKSFNVGGSENV